MASVMCNKRAFTLVEVMIVAAIIALLAALAIPNSRRSRMTANESVAQATLKTISTACETFAASNSGIYPTQESDLIGTTPPYLNRAYDGQALRGYIYGYTLATGGYTITAIPEACGVTGNTAYTITTGSVLTSSACS